MSWIAFYRPIYLISLWNLYVKIVYDITTLEKCKWKCRYQILQCDYESMILKQKIEKNIYSLQPNESKLFTMSQCLDICVSYFIYWNVHPVGLCKAKLFTWRFPHLSHVTDGGLQFLAHLRKRLVPVCHFF